MGDPLRDLLVAKPAFRGTTEAGQLAALIDRRLCRGNVDWLEVGAGDGRNLHYLVSRLSAGRRFRVVALEPASRRPEPWDGSEWLRLKVEDYRPDRLFDCINMRHSSYYIADAAAAITRLAGTLRHDGALALTHWARDCILRRLHVALCGVSGDHAVAGIEDLARTLAQNKDLLVSDVVHTDAELEVERVDGDRAVAEAVYKLACRGRRPIENGHIDRAQTVRRLLHTLPDAAARRNGIIVVMRLPD